MSLREHLQEIYDQHDRLTPELVVEASRPKDHPLHGYVFDRAPKEAAEAWYRHRAHELIQRVNVTYKPTDEEDQHRVRAFLAVRKETGYSYEPVEKVAENPEMRELVLREMERDWRQLHTRYGHFSEFVTLVSASLVEPVAA